MKEKLKHFVKRTIPASIIELFLPKKVGITKFPQNQSVISDLFIFRIEENWETYFELLNVQNVISPGTEAEVPDKATVFFFNNDVGCYNTLYIGYYDCYGVESLQVDLEYVCNIKFLHYLEMSRTFT